MPFDSSKSVYGKFTGPEEDQSVEFLLVFLEKQLPEFSKKYSKARIKNEEGLSQKLFLLLECNSRDYPFFFGREYITIPENGNSPRVDFGVIAEGK